MKQTLWLKITGIYSLTGLEVRSPKSVSLGKCQGVSVSAFLLEALGGNPSPCLLQLLEASCIPWLVAQHGYILCFPGQMSLSPSDPPDFIL